MRTRLATIASLTALAALLSACVSRPVVVNTLPPTVAVAPATTTIVTAPAPATLEFGRITNIEFFQTGAPTSGINVPAAIVGGIAGAVVGNAISGGRDAATVLGGVAGAAVGSQVNRPSGAVSSVYRVTIQTDAGGWRTYDVPATGDLRIGDRVRVENGVIYRA
jgi:outer membrane lipoprotein SlyB